MFLLLPSGLFDSLSCDPVSDEPDEDENEDDGTDDERTCSEEQPEQAEEGSEEETKSFTKDACGACFDPSEEVFHVVLRSEMAEDSASLGSAETKSKGILIDK